MVKKEGKRKNVVFFSECMEKEERRDLVVRVRQMVKDARLSMVLSDRSKGVQLGREIRSEKR